MAGARGDVSTGARGAGARGDVSAGARGSGTRGDGSAGARGDAGPGRAARPLAAARDTRTSVFNMTSATQNGVATGGSAGPRHGRVGHGVATGGRAGPRHGRGGPIPLALAQRRGEGAGTAGSRGSLAPSGG